MSTIDRFGILTPFDLEWQIVAIRSDLGKSLQRSKMYFIGNFIQSEDVIVTIIISITIILQCLLKLCQEGTLTLSSGKSVNAYKTAALEEKLSAAEPYLEDLMFKGYPNTLTSHQSRALGILILSPYFSQEDQ